MAIHHYLQETVFEPDDIRSLTEAYEAALELLRLNDRQGPITELVAAKIIDAHRSGERDPARICAHAIKELGVPISYD